MIMGAKCDTLVILDCFHDKLEPPTDTHPASILQGEEYAYDTEFRKHLIGACEPDPLTFVLKAGFKNPGSSMSVSTLVQHLNNRLVKENQEPLAFHLDLSEIDRGEMIISRLGDEFLGSDPELSELSGTDTSESSDTDSMPESSDTDMPEAPEEEE